MQIDSGIVFSNKTTGVCSYEPCRSNYAGFEDTGVEGVEVHPDNMANLSVPENSANADN